MKVRIRSFYTIGPAKGLGTDFNRNGDLLFEIEEGATVETLLRRFPHLGPPELYDDIMVHVFVNGELQGFDYVLRPEDIIDIHLPVTGG